MLAANPSEHPSTLKSEPICRGGVVDPAAWIDAFAYRRDDFLCFSAASGHYVPARRPLTPRDVRSGVAGTGATISLLFVRGDGTAKVGAVDADGSDGWDTLAAVAAALAVRGIPNAVERSRRGGHLWVVADEPVEAVVVRHALAVAVGLAGHDRDDPKIEIRPLEVWSGSDGKRSRYAGGALRGPSMPHPATEVAYPLVDPVTGEPLVEMPIADHDLLVRLATEWRPSAEATRPRRTVPRTKYDGPSKVAAYNAAKTVWDVLELYFPGHLAGRSPGAARCPFHDDRRASLSMYANGTKARCHAAGCILESRGPETAFGLALLCKEVGR